MYTYYETIDGEEMKFLVKQGAKFCKYIQNLDGTVTYLFYEPEYCINLLEEYATRHKNNKSIKK